MGAAPLGGAPARRGLYVLTARFLRTHHDSTSEPQGRIITTGLLLCSLPFLLI